MAEDIEQEKPEDLAAGEPAAGQEEEKVPAGTQVSASAGAGRRVQDVMGRMVPEDEQLLE